MSRGIFLLWFACFCLDSRASLDHREEDRGLWSLEEEPAYYYRPGPLDLLDDLEYGIPDGEGVGDGVGNGIEIDNGDPVVSGSGPSEDHPEL